MMWLLNTVSHDYFRDHPIDIEVLIANSHGNPFTTFAVHYHKGNPFDIWPEIEEKVIEINNTYPVTHFCAYIISHKEEIDKMVAKLNEEVDKAYRVKLK